MARASHRRLSKWLPAAVLRAVLSAGLAPGAAAAQERRNWFNDPFAQATRGFAQCPVPEGPLLTQDEMRREAHQRAERGTRCWMEKKCDAPNAYAHDAEINAAVVAALAAEPRWRKTSVWVTTQRMFVTLQGCVRNTAQREALMRRVRAVPRVEYVVDELLIGKPAAHARAPYRVAP
jgi:hypothetical protein